jgi:hypothetical protein
MTIAEHMREVLLETDNAAVMWGDVHLLDDCASRCIHTTLMEAHPMVRHKRILDALDHSSLFEKHYVRVDLWNGRGYAGRHVRYFKLRLDKQG